MPRHALIPCLRYRDAPAAIDFLCDAFDPEGNVWNFTSYDPWAGVA